MTTTNAIAMPPLIAAVAARTLQPGEQVRHGCGIFVDYAEGQPIREPDENDPMMVVGDMVCHPGQFLMIDCRTGRLIPWSPV